PCPRRDKHQDSDGHWVDAFALPAGGELTAVLAPEDMIEVRPRAPLDQLNRERVLEEPGAALISSVPRQGGKRRRKACVGEWVPHLDEQVGGEQLEGFDAQPDV